MHPHKYCACFECTLLQEQPIVVKEPHVSVGLCSCSSCRELQRKQEEAWDKRLHQYIENRRLILSLNEDTIISKQQLDAIEEHFHGNSLIQLLVNNARYFRSMAIKQQTQRTPS
jgi:hypothetical protein